MAPELETHTLVRIRGPRAIATASGADLPAWAAESLRRAPWVVIRRAHLQEGLVPVGVRGEARDERLAAWLSPDDALEYVTPQGLVSTGAWTRAAAADAVRHGAIAALAVRDSVERIMHEHGLEKLWGPGGSVGFELASGEPAVTASSDLDLVVEIVRPEIIASSAPSLWNALAALPVRADVLLETPRGAIALSEYVRVRAGDKDRHSLVLRTRTGPCLIESIAAL
jgi:phosphoribosyl-dephospho-CoA transferase